MYMTIRTPASKFVEIQLLDIISLFLNLFVICARLIVLKFNGVRIYPAYINFLHFLIFRPMREKYSRRTL